MASIIAIANQKGGVGKTTTTANLGASLALRGARTLLIDLDPQAHLTINYGIDKALSDPWNMLAGAQLFVGKNWEFRTEAGFIGRWSILAGLAYRLNL